MKNGISPDEIGDDELLSLSKACKLLFHGELTKYSLRTEHRKGNLEIVRIANKDFVTKHGIRKMIEKCTVRQEPSAPLKPSRNPSLPLEYSAKDAARQIVKQMRDDEVRKSREKAERQRERQSKKDLSISRPTSACGASRRQPVPRLDK